MIGKNEINEEMATILGQALKENKKLEELNLSNQQNLRHYRR
jgi:hypothetical protein